MMARLGMRAGEVRQLNLNDIDWIEGEIHGRAGKSRRELCPGGKSSAQSRPVIETASIAATAHAFNVIGVAG